MNIYKTISKIAFASLALSLSFQNISDAARQESLHARSSISSISIPLVTQNNHPFGFINKTGTQIIYSSGSQKNALHFGEIHGEARQKNNLFGFLVGSRTDLVYNNLTFDALEKTASGENFQKLNIKGQTNIGLFAEPTNIGTFKNNKLTILPTLQAKLGYILAPFIRPFFTYNRIYIKNINRSGQQIDRNINLSQNRLIGGSGALSGITSPGAKFNNTGMSTQGISVGIELNLY